MISTRHPVAERTHSRKARELRPFLRRLTPETSVAGRDLPGGTAPRRVRVALAHARKRLDRMGSPKSP